MDSSRPHRRSTPPRRTIGQRAIFFWVAALVCVLLVPASPSEFRWVVWDTAALGFFWALVLTVEDLLGPGGAVGDRIERDSSGSPFAPPPRPGRRTDDN
jgi:hypothetical protein